MGDALGMLVYIISALSFLFVKLYTTIEFSATAAQARAWRFEAHEYTMERFGHTTMGGI